MHSVSQILGLNGSKDMYNPLIPHIFEKYIGYFGNVSYCCIHSCSVTQTEQYISHEHIPKINLLPRY